MPSLYRGGGAALFIRFLYHASFWGVFCVTPVLCTGYDAMVEGLTCPHGCVQYGCCVVVRTFSWPWMSVGRLRDTVPVRCDLCVHGDGVLANVCGALDNWCTGLQCCSLAVWLWLGWLVVLIVPWFLSLLALPGLCCFLRVTHPVLYIDMS